jgi:hypothetical protein
MELRIYLLFIIVIVGYLASISTAKAVGLNTDAPGDKIATADST